VEERLDKAREALNDERLQKVLAEHVELKENLEAKLRYLFGLPQKSDATDGGGDGQNREFEEEEGESEG